MANRAPSAWSLVLIPAIVSLVVSILRRVGELNGWNDTLFSNAAPGPEQKPGLVGIAWLVPIFGFWFGFALKRRGAGPAHAGKAALRFAIGLGVMIGGFMLLMASGLIVMPEVKAPGTPTGLGYSLILVVFAMGVMFTAWPRLGWTLVLYGLLARIPVVVITYLALERGWDTHHTKLPAGTVLPEGTTPFMFLALPQLTFWIVFTMGIGGLAGCLGAALARREASAVR
jgi:hypothetical protein